MIVEDSFGASVLDERKGVNDVMLNNPLAIFSSIIRSVVIQKNRWEIQLIWPSDNEGEEITGAWEMRELEHSKWIYGVQLGVFHLLLI